LLTLIETQVIMGWVLYLRTLKIFQTYYVKLKLGICQNRKIYQ